jgi:crotonobetainyl-CoA:carnitine CoA-transferase CaiB-like acyl-CoA transferase
MGPLAGLKVVELGAIGPAPMAAMLLADMGATVLRIDRLEPSGLGVPRPLRYDLLLRNRSSIQLDLKRPESVELVLDMVERADVLLEGFRPGVCERIGLGPEACLARNPRLVFGRMTGWGQDGPMAQEVGHDLNYLALTGVLAAIGRKGQAPAIPLNLVGDFGGGALYLVVGVLAALHERKSSGAGQVVDAAIIDGLASLMTQPHGSLAGGVISNVRGSNPTDSGAPFYEVYECSDGRWVTIAAVEGKFYAQALQVLGLESLHVHQWDKSQWPAAKEAIAARIRERSQQQWCEAFAGTESCFAPVLSMAEAPNHPHLRDRGTYIDVEGIVQPAPAPRFSRSQNLTPSAHRPWSPSEASLILEPWLDPERIRQALDSGLFDPRPPTTKP